jgi:hypothetical protein
MKKLIITISLFLAFQSVEAQWSEYGKGMVFKSTFNYNSSTGVRNYDAPIEIYLFDTELKIVYVDGTYERYYAKSSYSIDNGYNNEGLKYYTYKFTSYKNGKFIFFQIFQNTNSVGKQIVRILYADSYIEFQ